MKKKVIIGIIVLIVLIGIVNSLSKHSQDKTTSEAANPTPTTAVTATPSYLTPQQTVKGLDTFFTLSKVGDVPGGIAWDGINSETGTRVRVITDKTQQDKVTTVMVWAKVSNDEAKDRVSLSILKTVAANTAPDSIDWLNTAYATAVKSPGENQEKTFGNKAISISYADLTGQLTFNEEVK